MAGVEVHREEGGIIDVQGKKGDETINIEVWKTHLPEWIIIRVREVIEPDPTVIEKVTFDFLPNDGIIHAKPNSEISRLKILMEVFNALSGSDRNDVEENILINEIVNTGKLTEEGAKYIINKAMQNGQIYNRKPGFYAKA